MSTVQPVAPEASPPRVAIAGCAGMTIEVYDFFIYAAALALPTVFFPALGATAGTVAPSPLAESAATS